MTYIKDVIVIAVDRGDRCQGVAKRILSDYSRGEMKMMKLLDWLREKEKYSCMLLFIGEKGYLVNLHLLTNYILYSTGVVEPVDDIFLSLLDLPFGFALWV